jgi:hypothetical protein
MIEQDYIMRMITMMTAVIARVLHLKYAREFPQALLELETASKSILGIPIALLNGLTEDQIIDLYHSDLTASAVKLHVAGLLLKEEADLLAVQGRTEECTAYSSKALSLLLESLLAIGEPMEEHHLTAIDALRERLKDLPMSVALRGRLMRFYEWQGSFAKAEDLLFDIMDEDELYAGEGVAFYQRLLKKSDTALTHGNLPREEVQEGLRRVQDRLRFIRIRRD